MIGPLTFAQMSIKLMITMVSQLFCRINVFFLFLFLITDSMSVRHVLNRGCYVHLNVVVFNILCALCNVFADIKQWWTSSRMRLKRVQYKKWRWVNVHILYTFNVCQNDQQMAALTNAHMSIKLTITMVLQLFCGTAVLFKFVCLVTDSMSVRHVLKRLLRSF